MAHRDDQDLDAQSEAAETPLVLVIVKRAVSVAMFALGGFVAWWIYIHDPMEPMHGGTGGKPKTLVCPKGSVQSIRISRHPKGDVGSLQVLCTPTSSSRSKKTKTAGRESGEVQVQTCSEGVAVGIAGRAGRYVHDVDLLCRDKAGQITGADKSETLSDAAWFRQTCAPDESFRGLETRSGSLIDAVGIVCD